MSSTRKVTLKQRQSNRDKAREYKKVNRKSVNDKAKKRYHENKEVIRERSKRYYVDNLDYFRSPEYRFYKLNKKYRITENDFKSVFSLQGGRCALCPYTFSDVKGSDVKRDHCHVTGLFRGLLCQQCNILLGYLERLNFNMDIQRAYIINTPARMAGVWAKIR